MKLDEHPVSATDRRPPAPPSRAGIAAAGLVKHFGEVRAVEGVSLAVAPGEIFGLLGPNGSGKTTTVQMLVTILPPTGGEAWVAGHDVVSEPGMVRLRIGVALQDIALDPLMNAWDHLTLQGALHGMGRRQAKARGEELIERVDLGEAAHRRVRTYSGGMKRRLDLALALVHEPEVLFLDEPTTGLDPHSRAAIWAEVSRLARREGVAVFLTTQYLEEADELADRVAILDGGSVVCEGTPQELKDAVGARSILLRAQGDQVAAAAATLSAFGDATASTDGTVRCQLSHRPAALATIVRALDAAQVDLRSLEVHDPTLNDVFFAHTGRVLEVGDQA